MTRGTAKPYAAPGGALPEFPKADEFGYAFDERSAMDAALRFQRARADAWEARCRLAVEALQSLGQGLGCKCGGKVVSVAEALAAIGELPELPP